MIRNITRDIEFLSIPSSDLKKDDLFILDDLKDTLKAHLNGCVGMAANMIGYSLNAIVFVNEKEELEVMVHPKIIKFEGEYKTKEGCLSLDGQRECIRYKKIKVEYYTKDMQKRIKTFKDFTAEIIQHEIDHLAGIII